MQINVEILYVDNCPNYTKACSILCDIIAEQDLNASISITKVHDHSLSQNFHGSPTVLINGKDVEICFNEHNEVENKVATLDAIACRLYDCDEGRGCPSHEMVRCSILDLE